MRHLWGSDQKLDWDDPIPEENRENWITFFKGLQDTGQIRFMRCIKPSDAIGEPILIVFSDASQDAYAACAYVQWKLQNGQFESNLILSKNRLAPIKKISIDRNELCGAVLNKRLKTFIEKECRYRFQRIYHIVDSQIVHAMIQKNSYRFNTFAATRIGEIQEGTSQTDWYRVESEHNIADCLMRGKKPSDIGLESIWQKGPEFLTQPEDEWPITRNYLEPQLPERVKTAMATNIERFQNTLAGRIDITKYSNIENGKYKRLCPKMREDGVYVIRGRSELWMEMSYNKREVILLPYDHPFSHLFIEHKHRIGRHHGVLTTASKAHTRYWIPKLLKLVKSIKSKCVSCRKLDKRVSEQVMGNLLTDRLKQAPPWYSTGIDLFGPYRIRDEIKKRTTSKAYGVIFNCLGTRAVYLDIAADYSTDKFLMVLRRFVSLHGYPSKLFSDKGTQLVAANKELSNITKNWDWNNLKGFCVTEGFEWIFTSTDAPWQNGVTEALIRSVKRAINASIGDSILTFSE